MTAPVARSISTRPVTSTASSSKSSGKTAPSSRRARCNKHLTDGLNWRRPGSDPGPSAFLCRQPPDRDAPFGGLDGNLEMFGLHHVQHLAGPEGGCIAPTAMAHAVEDDAVAPRHPLGLAEGLGDLVACRIVQRRVPSDVP